MATTKSSRYTTSNLSPDSLEASLKAFMQYQTTFKDYDFSASGLSSLISLLTYNTIYNGTYDNFALNESFLDSAVKRQNILSHANTLNYTARGYISSTAVVNLILTANIDTSETELPANLVLNPYTPFKTTINGEEYTFYTTGSTRGVLSGNVYTFSNVELKEGAFMTLTKEYRGSYYETFVLDSENVDQTSLNVRVYENAESSSYEIYTKAESFLSLDGNSKVFFLRNNPKGYYEIQFGNGTFGKALVTGNVVVVTYLTCHGSDANGAKSFTFNGSFGSNFSSKVVCTTVASGGQEPETVEEIRYNAPKYFTTQNRCVTANDYIYTIKALYSNAKSVNAWGGQTMNPPQYGKVFISIIPKTGKVLPESEKRYIKNEILQKRQVLTQLVEFVDPEYVRVGLDINLYYDESKTASNAEDLENLTLSTIVNYNDQNLNDYGSVLRFSRLSTTIDSVDDSVLNNSTKVTLYKDLALSLDGEEHSYTVNVFNEILKEGTASESVLSTGFECPYVSGSVCYIDDDPIGNTLNLFYYDELGNKVYVKSVGTIDYKNGILSIENFRCNALEGLNFYFKIVPVSRDVSSTQNTFVTIDDSVVTVKAIPTT